ncbi:MAG: erythromycin esterase family protein [Gammaproteobacteria bacterium]
MSEQVYEKLINVITDAAEPLSETKDKYSSLLDNIGDSRFVLIGEASHGTHEFYQARIEITQKLIEQKGFMAVAIEGDWPDAYRIHRYLQGKDSEKNWKQALEDFKRFPTWMWRNATLSPFLQWLRMHNDSQSAAAKVGFYGLDLYSLYSSMNAVVDYLSKVDPEAAERARLRYACFDHIKPDPQTYGYLTSMGIKKSCVNEAVEELLDLQYHAFDYIHQDGIADADEYFYATQNARLVKNAENYYRTMFEGHVSSWNVRDKHMAETLNILADHLENRFGKPAKIIIWAHNSHVGDARATEMGTQGEVNIGQLIREQHDADTYLIGFSTYQGSVTAASAWDAPAECKKVNPGLKGSYEELFHHIKYDNFLLNLRSNKQLEHYLHIPRLQRAIGVIYRPETERASHYFFTRLPYQFDSIIHFDNTTAVQPLD